MEGRYGLDIKGYVFRAQSVAQGSNWGRKFLFWGGIVLAVPLVLGGMFFLCGGCCGRDDEDGGKHSGAQDEPCVGDDGQREQVGVVGRFMDQEDNTGSETCSGDTKGEAKDDTSSAEQMVQGDDIEESKALPMPDSSDRREGDKSSLQFPWPDTLMTRAVRRVKLEHINLSLLDGLGGFAYESTPVKDHRRKAIRVAVDWETRLDDQMVRVTDLGPWGLRFDVSERTGRGIQVELPAPEGMEGKPVVGVVAWSRKRPRRDEFRTSVVFSETPGLEQTWVARFMATLGPYPELLGRRFADLSLEVELKGDNGGYKGLLLDLGLAGAVVSIQGDLGALDSLCGEEGGVQLSLPAFGKARGVDLSCGRPMSRLDDNIDGVLFCGFKDDLLDSLADFAVYLSELSHSLRGGD